MSINISVKKKPKTKLSEKQVKNIVQRVVSGLTKEEKGKLVSETLPLPDSEKKRRAKERAKDTADRQRDNKRHYKNAMAKTRDTLKDQNQEMMRLAHGIVEEENENDPFITISKEQMENLLSLFDEEGSYLGDDGEGMVQVRLSALANMLASPDLETLLASPPMDEKKKKGKPTKPQCVPGNPHRDRLGRMTDKTSKGTPVAGPVSGKQTRHKQRRFHAAGRVPTGAKTAQTRTENLQRGSFRHP